MAVAGCGGPVETDGTDPAAASTEEPTVGSQSSALGYYCTPGGGVLVSCNLQIECAKHACCREYSWCKPSASAE